MPKVIHLIPVDGIGGVELAARSMLGKKITDIDFFIMFIAGKCLVSDSKHVIESSFSSENNPFAHINSIYRIIKESPDILVCSLWRTIFIGIFVKLFLRKCHLVCFFHLASPAHILDNYLHKLMLLFCDSIWADSTSTLHARVRNTSKPKRVISFVTSQRITTKSINEFSAKFVFWGRLNHQKGIDRSIALIQKLIALGCDATYDIWGPDDGKLSSLSNYISSHELKNIVFLKGPVEQKDLALVSQNNSFYLQLSREEGMAMSVVEAMQFGLVPVVTPVGEISKYCKTGVNSLVLNSCEQISVVANELINLLKNETQYRTMQKNSKEYWLNDPIYFDDFISACLELYSKPSEEEWVNESVINNAPVSVIIPCFCCGSTIERAVFSIATQTVRPIEVILVDDASDDDTLIHLKTLEKQYPDLVKIISLSVNLGVASARNAAWEIATQPYIAFLDSDDAWHPRKIEIQYAYMKENPEVMLSGHAYMQVYKRDVAGGKINFPINKAPVFYKISRNQILWSNCFSTPSVMLRGDIVQRFPSGKRYGEDYYLWVELCSSSLKCSRIDIPLTYIYKDSYGETGLSAELWQMEKGELFAYENLFNKKLISHPFWIILNFWSLIKFTRRIILLKIKR